MSTRGAYGFRYKETDKIQYNHCDSYPSGLGTDICKFISKHPVEKLKKFFNRIMLKKHDNELYDKLRSIQGNLDSLMKKKTPVMIDNKDFLQDSLFCEWGYVINLDTEVLEVYKGWQNEATRNRYYLTPRERKNLGFNEEYKNCKLIGSIPLSIIHSDFDICGYLKISD